MTFRCKSILQAAKDAPHCMNCELDDETVIAAHSNQLRDGKGTGHKAADYRVAYLCSKCHDLIDNNKCLSRFDRIGLWEEAHRATIGWLFESGRITI